MYQVAGVVLALVMSIAGLSVPAHAAGVPTTQVQSLYESAKARASCLTDAQRNTIRLRVAADYLDEAHRAYSVTRRLNAEITNYLPDAVAHYRWYLNGVLHAIVTGEGTGCTSTIVAWFPRSGSMVFLTEEEFAQAQRGPVELSQGCCSNGFGNWSNGETAYGANLGGAGNGPCDPGCIGALGNTFGWAAQSAWGIAQIGLGLAMLSTPLGRSLSTPLTLDDLVALGTALTTSIHGFVDLAGAIERASGGDHCGCNGDK